MPDQSYSLEEAIKDLHTARSLADTLQAVADGVVNGLDYELAWVNLVRPDSDLVVASFAGDAAAEAQITGRVGSRAAWDRRLTMGEAWGDLRFIPHTDGPVLDEDDVPEWRADCPVPSSEEGWHPCDRLFAPMRTPGFSGSPQELVGVISVGWPRKRRRPGKEQREALQSYAFHAAIAISNARLRANMQRALVRLEREQQVMRASEESFRHAFEYAPSGLVISEMGGDQHGRILRTNDALCRLLGRDASAMRRYSFSDLVHPEDIGTLLRTAAEGGRAEVRLGRRDGTYAWVSLRNSVVADAADGPRFLLTHVEDIEDHKLRELQLLHQVSHDATTGLPNITELRARLNSRLCDDPRRPPGAGPDTAHQHIQTPENAPHDTRGLAVLVCDLDGFKTINDVLGHQSGDAVLVEVARRLSSVAPDGNTVARTGGDEFAVIADNINQTAAQNLAVQLHDAIVQPIRIDGLELVVRASFGIAWARCGMTAYQVMEKANERMHVEKHSPLSVDE
ncbi:diguanylate cyclase CdgB [Streptomyces sp. YS415]|uniref:diguanylate cyclase CdgB n=1 Tax=Streptomyces sp. YS415 TaxID=2944806 RepID=UPI0020203EDA|nr:diguanylate cyclase CdgB [Streptomyces sp. YS415]MCL7429815.1 diguanylate cyclase CdgB [Streptomyces sp. YS415]